MKDTNDQHDKFAAVPIVVRCDASANPCTVTVDTVTMLDLLWMHQRLSEIAGDEAVSIAMRTTIGIGERALRFADAMDALAVTCGSLKQGRAK